MLSRCCYGRMWTATRDPREAHWLGWSPGRCWLARRRLVLPVSFPDSAIAIYMLMFDWGAVRHDETRR
jgi:hypothetical protein